MDKLANMANVKALEEYLNFRVCCQLAHGSCLRLEGLAGEKASMETVPTQTCQGAKMLSPTMGSHLS